MEIEKRTHTSVVVVMCPECGIAMKCLGDVEGALRYYCDECGETAERSER
ncbi:MAG: hypothetical protein QG620_314 [Patescibacteria group bacterium]|nr:hypothetical protein [Patescibacteria group bacterium]